MNEFAKHWLRPLTSDKRPNMNVYIDCEARVVETNHDIFDHKFLLGCVTSDMGETYTFDDAFELWEAVTKLAPRRKTTYVWAHNASYDVRLSKGMKHLLKLGWNMERFAIDDRSFWMKWNRGNKTKNPTRLFIVDSHSFIPGSMKQIYNDHGGEQISFEYGDDMLLDRRCRDDVEHLRIAVRDLYEFLDEEHCGPMAITGAGQSFNSYRRRFLPDKTILVNDMISVLGEEREAAWAGRSEAWKWGEFEGNYYEYDFELAYPMLCVDQLLPVQYLRPTSYKSTYVTTSPYVIPGYTKLLRCRVKTEVPVLPTRGGPNGGIIWPVGEFEGWYWLPEVYMAIENGARIDVIMGHEYKTAPVLDTWARWIIDVVRNHKNPTIRRVAKMWARTVIGRFALRYPEWELEGEWDGFEDDFLKANPAYIGGIHTYTLQVGSKIYKKVDDEESGNSIPAITSYIASLGRVRLWNLLRDIGFDRVLYMDTDSVICDGPSNVVRSPEYGDLKLKGVYNRLTIFGQRQLILDGKARIAGLPLNAQRREDGVWIAERFSGPAEGRVGALESVQTRRQGFVLHHADGRRERLSDGRTEPVRVRV